jgi:hypothetical protein
MCDVAGVRITLVAGGSAAPTIRQTGPSMKKTRALSAGRRAVAAGT